MPADAVLIGLVSAMGALIVGVSGTIVALRNSHATERAKLIDQYQTMADELRTENARLTQWVRRLEECTEQLELRIAALKEELVSLRGVELRQ